MTQERYSIGALARLAGVPVETLRTWERRYGIPAPTVRADGPRTFDSGEVDRVRMVAELSRLGERVRDLAPLDASALTDRLAAHRAARREAPLPTTLRVVAVLAHPEGLGGISPSGLMRLELVATAATPDALPTLDEPVDVLVVAPEDPAADILALVDLAVARVRPDAIVVRAPFLTTRARRGLTERRVRVVTDPRLAELRRAIEDAAIVTRVEAGARPTPPPSERRLTADEIARLLAAPSAVSCECLNHLAGIVTTLDAFERYSRGCVTDGGADMELHRALAEGTATACAQMEALLVRVARHEGFPF